jgi:hypothetical protein
MMNRIPVIFLLLLPLQVQAQLTYRDASGFPLLGKASSDTETRYERLPAHLKGVSREPVWNLGKSTAGMAVRFRSNTTAVGVRWTLCNDAVMNHMSPSGIKGLDLYCLEDDSTWHYAGTALPKAADNKTKENTAIIRTNMEKKDREFMLFLPLYDGITALEIGVDSPAGTGQPAVNLPLRKKPVVAYGTSILQGGCASRPGMAHTSILMRRLNREFINLGFSGNALLDCEIAELMATCDASLYLLDFMPNVSVKLIEERLQKFYFIIRSKRPGVPVVFIEDFVYPPLRYDASYRQATAKNKALHTAFDKLKSQGEKDIYLLPSASMIGADGEATVDGIHFTDLGFMRYAEYLYPEIKRIIPNRY